MKKTFTANIAGTVFHVEEDAYEALKRYLENIRANFSGSAAANEIMSDVEARIAELFTERLQGCNVVMLDDVLHVQSIMGKPEDFGGDEAAGAASEPGAGAGAGIPRKHKRLFRDMEDNWIGGVISGFANYIGVDPLWVRIAFLILFFASKGIPLFLIYILMWVLVPAALTAAEKLEMRGEPVTVDNIKKVFEEGAEKVKQGGKTVANEAQEWGRKWQSGDMRPRAQAAASGFERFIKTIFSVFAKVVGGSAIFIAALLAFALVALLAGHSSYIMRNNGLQVTDLTQLANDFFTDPWMVHWGWIGLTVCLLIPVIALMLGGMRLLFGVKVPKMFAWVLTPIWIMAIGLVTFIAIRGANEVRNGEHVTEDTAFAVPSGGVMHLSAMNDPYFGNDRDEYSGDIDLIDIEGDEIRYGYASLDVKSSPDSLFHLEIRRGARGLSIKDAAQRARAIHVKYDHVDSALVFAPYYTVARDQKLRAQEVEYILRVPVGASIRFERSTGRIIHDISNTTDTWDKEMVGRTWTMTPEGLAPGEGGGSGEPPVSQPTSEDNDHKGHRHRVRNNQLNTVHVPSIFGALRNLVRI